MVRTGEKGGRKKSSQAERRRNKNKIFNFTFSMHEAITGLFKYELFMQKLRNYGSHFQDEICRMVGWQETHRNKKNFLCDDYSVGVEM